jgi:Tfp pilus assembly protein PilP
MRVILLTLSLLTAASAAIAQTLPARPQPDAAAGAPTPPVLPALMPATVDTYTYQADGRRDPFLSLTASVASASVPTTRAEGLAGLGVADLSIRGVMKSKGALIATVQGPDKRAYVVHQGDKFADGTVKAVTDDGLVIVQQVNDPLSLVKQREVRKLLRSVEDGKQ